MKKRIVRDKKRFEKISYILATIINVFLILGLSFIFMSIIPKNTVSAGSIIYEEYTVSAGETLWSIASEHKNNNKDIREYIYELQELNNIKDCMIYPNQTIKIIK